MFNERGVFFRSYRVGITYFLNELKMNVWSDGLYVTGTQHIELVQVEEKYI